ncbi:MAG TPA: hypothetical protein VMU77_02440 [Acidimicrobiales bacterium]|nr:hypothetical protein [Acidimicrobiales bacterium]
MSSEGTRHHSLPAFGTRMAASFEANGSFRAHLYNSNLFLLEKVADALSRHFGIEVTLYKRKANEFSLDSKIHQQADRFDLYVQSGGKQSLGQIHRNTDALALEEAKMLARSCGRFRSAHDNPRI